MPHQESTVAFGLQQKYCIYGLGPGLGKTLAALETFNRSGAERLLVICPSYLTLNWKSEVRKFYGEKKFIVSVFRKAKDGYFPVDNDIIIVSYDVGQKLEFLFEWADFVVFDEVHLLKSIDTKRSKFYHRVVFENSPKFMLGLSGTVIKNRVWELYSPLAMAHYRENEKSNFLDVFPTQTHFADYFSFRRDFDMWQGNRKIRITRWEGFKNEETLFKYLKNKYIRFDTEEVLKLQPIIEEVYNVSDRDDFKLLEAFEEWQENDSVAPDIKAKVALDKVGFTSEIAKSKLEEGLGPIIVFTDHRASCSAIAERLGCPSITGETPMGVRHRVGNEFQNGEHDFLVATIGSFSTGVNLTRSHCMIFNDYSWVPGDMAQALYRIRRIGQDKQCYVIKVTGSPQDEKIMRTLESKLEVIGRVNNSGD